MVWIQNTTLAVVQILGGVTLFSSHYLVIRWRHIIFLALSLYILVSSIFALTLNFVTICYPTLGISAFIILCKNNCLTMKDFLHSMRTWNLSYKFSRIPRRYQAWPNLGQRKEPSYASQRWGGIRDWLQIKWFINPFALQTIKV